MLATYMRRMRYNNLEIRIAGSSCRPQLNPQLFSMNSLGTGYIFHVNGILRRKCPYCVKSHRSYYGS